MSNNSSLTLINSTIIFNYSLILPPDSTIRLYLSSLYVNGNLEVSGSVNISLTSSTTPMIIGSCLTGNGTLYFDSIPADFKSTIIATYNCTSPPSAMNLNIQSESSRCSEYKLIANPDQLLLIRENSGNCQAEGQSSELMIAGIVCVALAIIIIPVAALLAWKCYQKKINDLRTELRYNLSTVVDIPSK